jgi:hypothetical protein
VDQVEDQVADLVEVLVEVLVVDREEWDRVEVDLGKVDLEEVGQEEVDQEEDHIHPVMGLEQVVQACGVELGPLVGDTGIHRGYCHQVLEVCHDCHGHREVRYHGRLGEGRWDRWDHRHLPYQQKAYGMCWDVECIGG